MAFRPKNSMKFVLCLTLLLAGCTTCELGGPTETLDEEAGTSAYMIFRLERNCSMCVSGSNYMVDLHDDGSVYFQWNEDGIAPKVHRYSVAKEQVDSLALAAYKAGMHRFASEYSSTVDSATGISYSFSDGAADAVYFNYAGQIKTISAITFPPDELRDILDGIERVARTEQWK